MSPLDGRTKQALVKNRLKTFMQLSAKHGRICWYCQCDIKFETCHIEHIVPVCRGGKSNLDNLAISCLPCNRAKGDMNVTAFVQWLKVPKKPLPCIQDIAKIGEEHWLRYAKDFKKGLRKPG